MRARIVRIGNSRGIRLPKPLIEQAGLGDEVELRIRRGEIVISRVAPTREGWAKAASELAEHESREGTETAPLMPMHNQFDEGEWEWEW